MFHLAENDIITMERGDYGVFQIKVDIGTPHAPSPYTLDSDDSVFLGIMEPQQQFEDALIKKVYTAKDQSNGLITVEINPADTLRLVPGTYYYSIKLRCLDEDKYVIKNGLQPSKVYTILPRTKFIIME